MVLSAEIEPHREIHYIIQLFSEILQRIQMCFQLLPFMLKNEFFKMNFQRFRSLFYLILTPFQESLDYFPCRDFYLFLS